MCPRELKTLFRKTFWRYLRSLQSKSSATISRGTSARRTARTARLQLRTQTWNSRETTTLQISWYHRRNPWSMIALQHINCFRYRRLISHPIEDHKYRKLIPVLPLEAAISATRRSILSQASDSACHKCPTRSSWRGTNCPSFRLQVNSKFQTNTNRSPGTTQSRTTTQWTRQWRKWWGCLATWVQSRPLLSAGWDVYKTNKIVTTHHTLSSPSLRKTHQLRWTQTQNLTQSLSQSQMKTMSMSARMKRPKSKQSKASIKTIASVHVGTCLQATEVLASTQSRSLSNRPRSMIHQSSTRSKR